MTATGADHGRIDPTMIRQLLGDSLGYLYPAALRVAARFAVADHLDEPRSAAELAARTGVDAGRLGRALRLLSTRGVFAEDDAGRFRLTPAARLLRTDAPVPLRSIVLLFTDEVYWRPAGRLDDTVRQGRTAFSDVFGRPFFDHLPTVPETEQLFADALATVSELEQEAVVAAYDFPTTGTVVDVAGGRGGLLRTVLTANPGLRGVLLDRAPVLERHLLDVPALTGRWRTEAGDLFQAVPPAGHVYLLKRILHDKSDAESAAVLASCRKAMANDARLLVVDAVVPSTPGAHPAVVSDVLMMALWDGRERTAEEFAALLAGEGFHLGRIIPTASALSVVEAVPV